MKDGQGILYPVGKAEFHHEVTIVQVLQGAQPWTRFHLDLLAAVLNTESINTSISTKFKHSKLRSVELVV